MIVDYYAESILSIIFIFYRIRRKYGVPIS